MKASVQSLHNIWGSKYPHQCFDTVVHDLDISHPNQAPSITIEKSYNKKSYIISWIMYGHIFRETFITSMYQDGNNNYELIHICTSELFMS